MSDFALIDAIERVVSSRCRGFGFGQRARSADAGLTQCLAGDPPVHAQGGAPDEAAEGRDAEPGQCLPKKSLGALHALYEHYETFVRWTELAIPPVFIVVCQNTSHSKLLYDNIAGYTRTKRAPKGEEREVVVPAKLPLFSNYDADGRRLARPLTLLIDSTDRTRLRRGTVNRVPQLRPLGNRCTQNRVGPALRPERKRQAMETHWVPRGSRWPPSTGAPSGLWIPAFAGMTRRNRCPSRRPQRNPRTRSRKASSRSWCTQWPAFSIETTCALRKWRTRPSLTGSDAQLSLP